MLTVFGTICMSVIDMPTALVLIIKDSHIEFFFFFLTLCSILRYYSLHM